MPGDGSAAKNEKDVGVETVDMIPDGMEIDGRASDSLFRASPLVREDGLW